jgi:isopenicillin N synthase-like dioxygenase
VTDPERIAALLKVFGLPAAEKRRLMNGRYAPENPNDYRGMISIMRAAPGGEPLLHTEGLDLGSDRPAPADADAVARYLLEANVWPDEALLPGFRALAERHYRELDALGHLMMRSFARYLRLGEDYFEPFFGGGASTLRFLRSPRRPDLTWENADERWQAEVGGRKVRLQTPAHRDSGVLTLLWQPGALQAQDPEGDWLDSPKVPRSLNVNFGDSLEFWTGGRLPATPHRVVAVEQDRCSIPFFFEPNVDAVIRPIPGAPTDRAPIRYADHVLSKIRLFGSHATRRLDAPRAA